MSIGSSVDELQWNKNTYILNQLYAIEHVSCYEFIYL